METDRAETGREERDDFIPSRRSRSRSPVRSRSRSPSPRRARRRSYSRSPPPAGRDRSRSPRRDRGRDDRGRDDRYSERYSERRRDDRDRRGPPRDFDDRRGGGGGYNREAAASEAARRSVKENRVYCGNLAFSVRWNDLKDFMRDAGNVVFAEVLQLPNGMSKGCGVVEYSSAEEAQRAIRELSDKSLMGRQVFIREDREEEARYGSAAVSERGVYPGASRGRGGRGGAFGGGRGGGSGGSRQLMVGGLNQEVGWQDLKDLFRQAGDIVRADVKYDESGMPSGTGTVLFTSSADAQNAISMFNGAELNGMRLEVHEERFSAPTSGPFAGAHSMPAREGAYGGGAYEGGGGPRPSTFNAQPSTQIFVKNLPWSTTNEDLIELFQTTGTVQYAEVLWEGTRSKGVGIVQFASQEEADTAIQKFQLYNYGGRPLSIEYNARWRDFATQPVVDRSSGGGGNSY